MTMAMAIGRADKPEELYPPADRIDRPTGGQVRTPLETVTSNINLALESTHARSVSYTLSSESTTPDTVAKRILSTTILVPMVGVASVAAGYAASILGYDPVVAVRTVGIAGLAIIGATVLSIMRDGNRNGSSEKR